MPGQHGAFPGLVLCLNFNVSIFLLLTGGSERMLYSVTEDIKHMSKPSDLVQGTLDMLLLKILALEPMNGFAVSQRLKQVSRRFAGERRIALPGFAQVGAGGLDYSRVENIRVWPAGEILFAHTARGATARKRSR